MYGVHPTISDHVFVVRSQPSTCSFSPSLLQDWSRVESEIKELEKTGDLDGGDPLSGFFQKIFSQVGGWWGCLYP